jgi:hypothetical protein
MPMTALDPTGNVGAVCALIVVVLIVAAIIWTRVFGLP